jgi:dipeptidyl aminopeptidase/acylaminoacyl peptidase
MAGQCYSWGENEIWKCDANTGENPARIFANGQPKAWAPDGREFIVVVEKEGRSDKTENWRVSVDGKTKSVLSLPFGEVVEDWSNDGRWLLSWSHADGQLYITKPDGSGRRRLTNTVSNASRNEHPRFSPDGRRIVYLQTLYQGNDNGPDSRFSLRTMNIDGTHNREILGEKKAAAPPAKATWTAPMGARWSPDGKHLAVVLFDHKRGGGILAINGNWRLAIIDGGGGDLRELKLEGVLNAVLPWDGPEWRASSPGVVTRESKQGAKLQPGTEERLQWGEPVKGPRKGAQGHPRRDACGARCAQCAAMGAGGGDRVAMLESSAIVVAGKLNDFIPCRQ